MKYSIIFLCVVVVKLFINASKYFQAKYLRRKYQESLTIKGKNFDEYIPQAKNCSLILVQVKWLSLSPSGSAISRLPLLVL